MEITYKATLIKWVVLAEESDQPVQDFMQKLAKDGEGRTEFYSDTACERIEKARHFIFDELMVNYRKWGYATIEDAVRMYASRFAASQKTKDSVVQEIMDAYRRKGVVS